MTNTDYAILGFLTHGDFSGYDIKKLIDESIPHFWDESYTKIYQSLKRLESKDMLYSISIDQSGKPDKKVYRITPEGKTQFVEWINKEVEPTIDINLLLLRIFFGSIAKEGKSKANTKIFLKEAKVQQEIYKEYQKFVASQPKTEKTDYWLCTIDYILGRLQFEIEWAERTLKKIN